MAWGGGGVADASICLNEALNGRGMPSKRDVSACKRGGIYINVKVAAGFRDGDFCGESDK